MPEPHERVEQPLKKILIHNFVGGIAWGIGATIGLTFFLAALGYIMSQIDYLPYVGSFISDIYSYVTEHNPKLREF